MALEAHMDGLTVRHRKLDEQIEEVRSHPSSDPLELARLKREKLRIKDALNRLQTENT
ncbi:MAG: DUF465 domain-containing protein [Pseudomonadota bacterium]